MKNGMVSRTTSVLAAVIAFAATANAATWYVAPEGNDGNDGQSWATAMKSPELVIDKWIAAANAAGTTVNTQTLVISNGYYRLSKELRLVKGNAEGEAINGIGSKIVIESYTGNPEDVVLDGQGACRGIYIWGSSNSTVSGLTIANGVATDVGGGGIFMRDNGTGNVKDCIVRDCSSLAASSAIHGGGIYAYQTTISGCTVENCTITNAVGAVGMSCRGGGIYGYLSIITNVTVRRCSIRMNSGTCSPCGAGIYIGSGSSYVAAHSKPGVYDSRISACEIDMPYASDGYGAGIFAECSIPDGGDGTQYQTEVSDCIVYDCTNHLGAAIFLNQHVDVVNTTSSNNWDAAASANASNSTGLHLGNRCHARGCLVVDNAGNTGDGSSTGSPAVLMGNDSSLVDSAIVGNTAPARVGVVFKDSSTTAMLVSNCVFKANRQTSALRGGLLCAYDLSAESVVDIVDCRFLDNDMSNCQWGGWIFAPSTVSERHWAVRFRNCLCTGNQFGKIGAASAWAASASSKTSSAHELSFENCTIAGNTMVSGYMIHGYEDGVLSWTHSSPSNIYVRGSIIVDNANSWAISPSTYSQTTNVNYSVFTPYGSTAWDSRQAGNKFYDSTKPLFEDSANGDYRLARRSQAIDMVPQRTWMGDGRKNGPKDLGSGYVIEKAGTYGVAISGVGTSARFSGIDADAGCCEYFWENRGFMVFVR